MRRYLTGHEALSYALENGVPLHVASDDGTPDREDVGELEARRVLAHHPEAVFVAVEDVVAAVPSWVTEAVSAVLHKLAPVSTN